MAVSVGAGDLGFVHRRTDVADIYFVANTSNVRQAVTATFRVSAQQAQLWNPLTGATAPVPLGLAAGRGGGALALDLAPYESTVVVFPIGVPASRPVHTAASARLPPPMDISSGWRVAFGPAGTPSEWTALHSWTDDEATRFFSGVAVYEKTVYAAGIAGAGSHAVRLDLGAPRPIEVGGPRARVQAWLDAPVRDAAVVTVNGRRAGAVWCPPYAVDVTALLHPGDNVIRIEVGNLAINHLAGHALPDYRLLNLRYGVRFEPQDMDKVQPVRPRASSGPSALWPRRPRAPPHPHDRTHTWLKTQRRGRPNPSTSTSASPSREGWLGFAVSSAKRPGRAHGGHGANNRAIFIGSGGGPSPFSGAFSSETSSGAELGFLYRPPPPPRGGGVYL